MTVTGGIKCWGDNSAGQLGDGTKTDSSVPVAVTGLDSGAASVAAGLAHSCAVMIDGGMKCWGKNDKGQIGDGMSSPEVLVPADVVGLGAQVVSATAGEKHTCALLVNGEIECWGHNDRGQLGNGTSPDRDVAESVLGISNAKSVSAGLKHTCASLATGSVACWGHNNQGQLGDGTTSDSNTPVPVAGLGDALMVAGGAEHTCAASLAGVASCWGRNDFGQLGDGTTTDSLVPVSVLLGPPPSAITVTAGEKFSCTSRSVTEVRCWGRNNKGQLGDGTSTDSLLPVAVAGTVAVATGGGREFACALTTTGAVKCWGDNGKGQLGDGTTTDSAVPVNVVGFP